MASVKLKVDKNTLPESRTVSIGISGGTTGISEQVNVSQAKGEEQVPSMGSEIEIPGYGNDNW